MTTLRQFRSSGPMRAPCSRGLSLGLLVPNVYWVLFFFVPGTLAAPCLTCFGFQPGCTFETTGKCPLVEIPVGHRDYSPSFVGFCFAYVRKDGKMSKVGGETSDTDKDKGEGTSAAISRVPCRGLLH